MISTIHNLLELKLGVMLTLNGQITFSPLHLVSLIRHAAMWLEQSTHRTEIRYIFIQLGSLV